VKQSKRDSSNTEPTPDYDIVVAGFGPSGAVAACWLGQAGLRTLVLDKSREIWQTPRAIAIDHEALRVFQNLGVAEQVLQYTAPFPASEHFGARGQLIRRVDAIPPPYPLDYVPTMVFTQPPVEAILRARAAQHRSVTISLGTEVLGLAKSSERVTLEVGDEAGGRRHVTASYVIACDGASSLIRRSLGIKLNDLGFDEPWMVIDARVSEAALATLPQTAAQYCDPARPTTFIVGPGNHRRWEIMLLPGEEARAMESEDEIWRLLSPWLTPADGQLWRASSYRFHALVAEKWRSGRVFLAGDAAHQQPPFLGQGMCQGIRDVTNLCWKLRTVFAGDGDDQLLNTYGEERSLHVLTLTSRIKAIGQHICERDPEAARLRDESLIEQGGGKAPTVFRQDVVPPLRCGLIADAAHPANGVLFPQPWIVTESGEVRMDELTGSGWRCVIDGRRLSPGDDLQRLPIDPIVVGGQGLAERDGVVGHWFDRNDCTGAIVRPDHYVYGVTRSVEELRTLFEHLQQIVSV